MPKLVRDRLTWVMYLQLALWCYFLYGFGPVAPLLTGELHISRTLAGLHGTAFAAGGVLVGAVMPALTRRYGRNRLIWTGLGMVSAGALGMFAAHHLALTLTCTTLAAFGGTTVVNVVVAALTDHHGTAGPAAISEANAAAAAVGLVAPLVVGAAYGLGFGWRAGLVLLVVPTVLLAFLAGVRPPEPAGWTGGTRGGTGATGVTGSVAPPATRLPVNFWLAALSLFATGSVEICLTLWGSEVLRGHAHVSAGVATAAVSTLIAGMMAGRIAGGRLLLVFRPARMLLVSLVMCGAGFAVFWSATVPWLAMAGLFGCGLGVGLHYPLGIGLALAHSSGQPDLAAARASFAVGISFAVAPFVLGALADTSGPHTAFLLVPVFLVLSGAAIVVLDRRTAPVVAAGVA